MSTPERGRPGTCGIPPRWLDLCYVRPEVGQDLGAIRACKILAHVHYTEALQVINHALPAALVGPFTDPFSASLAVRMPGRNGRMPRSASHCLGVAVRRSSLG